MFRAKKMYIEELHLQHDSTIDILKLFFLHNKKFTNHKDKVIFGEALKDLKMCILSIFLKLLCIIYSYFLLSKNQAFYLWMHNQTIRVESFLCFSSLCYVSLPSQNLIIHANRKNEYFPTYDYSCFHCKKFWEHFWCALQKKKTKQSGFMLSALL